MSDTAFVIPPPAIPFVPVRGGGRFPVRRVFCVGRNYAAHVAEMGGDAREPPFFFAKPADALVTGGADTPYPPATADLHHEVELVAALGGGGTDIAIDAALGHVWGYAVGIDLTRRDMQAAAKKAGKPWDMAKGFDASAPIGEMAPIGASFDPTRGAIELSIDGATRQSADLGDMIWSVAETIAALSKLVRLAPGDLIFTGTPEGVGAVALGSLLVGSIEGVGEVRTRVV